MIPLLLACAGPSAEDTGEAGVPATLALTDANNYTYEAGLTFSPVATRSGADAELDWAPLTRDLTGQALRRDEVIAIDLVWLRDLDEDELAGAILGGTLTQSDVGLWATWNNTAGVGATRLSAFSMLTSPFDPAAWFLADLGGTWLLRFSTSANPHAMLVVLRPEDTDNTRIAVQDDATTLRFEPDLEALERPTVGVVTVATDWSALTVAAGGVELAPESTQQAWLARFEGLSVADLEARFVELEKLATDAWMADVYGEDEVALSALVDDAGAAFPGVDAGATWLFALRCVGCASPAPAFLTVLDVE